MRMSQALSNTEVVELLVQEAVQPKVKGDSMAQTLALTCIGKHLLVHIHAELEQLLDYQGHHSCMGPSRSILAA